MQQFLQLAHIILREEILRGRLGQLLGLGAMQMPRRVVRQGQHIGGGAVVELHRVGVVEEEICLDGGCRQRTAGVVLLGQVAVVQHLGGDLLGFGQVVVVHRAAVQFAAQILADLHQALHQQGIEGAALAV